MGWCPQEARWCWTMIPLCLKWLWLSNLVLKLNHELTALVKTSYLFSSNRKFHQWLSLGRNSRETSLKVIVNSMKLIFEAHILWEDKVRINSLKRWTLQRSSLRRTRVKRRPYRFRRTLQNMNNKHRLIKSSWSHNRSSPWMKMSLCPQVHWNLWTQLSPSSKTSDTTSNLRTPE